MTKDTDLITVNRSISDERGILIDLKVRPKLREEAERGGEEDRHPIAAIILWNEEMSSILVVKKTATAGESRLHGTWSVFFGEHIKWEGEEGNLKPSSISRAVEEMVMEELGNVRIRLLDENPRFQIALSCSSVDLSHHGYVFEGIIEEVEVAKLSTDGTERILGFMNVEELYKNREHLNNWSKMIVEYIVRYRDECQG